MVKPVKFIRESDCLAREEFLVISKRDHILIHMYIFATCWVLYCLISYRAGDWHYRIFAELLKFGFKMASKTENAAKVNTCCLGDIKSQITPEKLRFYGKEQLLYYCKEPRLKTTGEYKDLIERLSPFGRCPDLFDKKVGQITVTFSFSTALKPTVIPTPSADWKVLGKDKDTIVPVVTDSTKATFVNI